MPKPVVGELIDLLQLERLEDNLFRGQSRDIGTRFVFGGQVLGQALSAAQRTVDDRRARCTRCTPTSCAPGDIEAPIVYQVDRTRDGKSFTTRRVSAIQHGEQIFGSRRLLPRRRAGVEHQSRCPRSRGRRSWRRPSRSTRECAHDQRQGLQRWLSRARAPSNSAMCTRATRSRRPSGRRSSMSGSALVDRIGDEQTLHRALLAYASDFHLIGTATFPHGVT